jgi:hypothetical protein
MITTYIKYAFFAVAIALGVAGVSYIISNEREKANLKMENQTLDISKQSAEQDLSTQKQITKTYSKRVNKEIEIKQKVNSVELPQIKTDSTIQDLDRIRSCELANINNLDVICK